MDDIRQQFPIGAKISADGATWIVVGHYGGAVPEGQAGFTNKRAGVVATPEGGEDAPKIFRREEFRVVMPDGLVR